MSAPWLVAVDRAGQRSAWAGCQALPSELDPPPSVARPLRACEQFPIAPKRGAHSRVHWNCAAPSAPSQTRRSPASRGARPPGRKRSTPPAGGRTAMSGFDINQLDHLGQPHPRPRAAHPHRHAAGLQHPHRPQRALQERAGDWADRAQYFDVTIWGGLGEWVAKNVASGDKVVVAGRLRWREWGDGRRQAPGRRHHRRQHHPDRTPQQHQGTADAPATSRPRAGPGRRLTATRWPAPIPGRATTPSAQR